MARKPAAPPSSVYQLKITLIDTSPAIWRRIQIDSAVTLGRFHDILQVVMGWEDCHMHDFRVPGPPRRFRGRELTPIEEEDEAATQLPDVLKDPKDFLVYVYDFGDNWEHQILLEEVMAPAADARLPIVLAGERAYPPDDVGGIGGYERFLEAIKNPDDPEHQDRLDWCGGEFDPDAFDLGAVNRALHPGPRSRMRGR